MKAMHFPKANRSVMMLTAAVLLGAAASMLAVRYIHQRIQLAASSAPAASKPDMISVVVPTKDLATGATVGYDNMAVRKIPADYVPAEAITPDAFNTIIGDKLNAPVKHGSALTKNILSSNYSHFSQVLDSNTFAYTLQVGETNAISGMVVPGDRVDLLFIAEHEGKQRVMRLSQNILVLATGQRAKDMPESGKDEHGFSNITLQVSPRQAERLTLAQKAGSVRVLLRSPAKGQRLTLSQMTQSELFNGPKAQDRPVEYIIGGGR
jgi:pilus assembly protein CpaB